MVNLGALNLFDSFIKKLEKGIGLCQPCALHSWTMSLFIAINFDHVLFYCFVIICLHLKINIIRYCQLLLVFILDSLGIKKETYAIIFKLKIT